VPTTEIVAPIRAKRRKDNVEPTVVSAIKDSVDPKRALLKTLTALAILAKQRKDKEAPT
jgi:hypothetical protein